MFVLFRKKFGGTLDKIRVLNLSGGFDSALKSLFQNIKEIPLENFDPYLDPKIQPKNSLTDLEHGNHQKSTKKILKTL